MPSYLSESLNKINFTYRVKRLEHYLATSRKQSGWWIVCSGVNSRLLCVHQNMLAGSLCNHMTGIMSTFCMRKIIVYTQIWWWRASEKSIPIIFFQWFEFVSNILCLFFGDGMALVVVVRSINFIICFTLQLLGPRWHKLYISCITVNYVIFWQ